jgi:hypothetical protein
VTLVKGGEPTTIYGTATVMPSGGWELQSKDMEQPGSYSLNAKLSVAGIGDSAWLPVAYSVEVVATASNEKAP